MKYFFCLIFTCFSSINYLNAFELNIINGIEDMVATKRICARILFDKSEQALYKDSICFSVNTSDLELTSWQTAAHDSVEYIHLLKRNKRLYPQSFYLEIMIDFDVKDKVQRAAVLCKTSLHVSALVLKKNGRMDAVTLMVPLTGVLSSVDNNFLSNAYSFTKTLSTTVTTTILNLWQKVKTSGKMVALGSNELLIVDRTKDLWLHIRTLFVQGLTSPMASRIFFILLLLVLGLIFFHCGVFFKRFGRWRRWWLWELEFLLTALLAIGFFIFCRHFIQRYLIYKILGFTCLPLAFYFLWSENDTLWGRIKVLVGLIFATAALPLLVKGYLLYYFLHN